MKVSSYILIALGAVLSAHFIPANVDAGCGCRGGGNQYTHSHYDQQGSSPAAWRAQRRAVKKDQAAAAKMQRSAISTTPKNDLSFGSQNLGNQGRNGEYRNEIGAADSFNPALSRSIYSKESASNGRSSVADRQTLAKAISVNPSYTTFAIALELTGLADELNGQTFYTVFIPTNDAFSKLPPGKLAELFRPENRKQLRSLVESHIAKGKILTPDLKTKTLTMQSGKTETVTPRMKDFYVGNARIVEGDITESNGVIHVVDEVITQ